MNKEIQAPVSAEVVNELSAGDMVYITGTIYTARDAAHKRMDEALAEGKELPIDIKGNLISNKGYDVTEYLKSKPAKSVRIG